jgi:hypothetical protein
VTEPGPAGDLAAELAELRGQVDALLGQLARSQGEIGALRAQLREQAEVNSGQVMMFRLEVKQLRAALAEAIEGRKLKPPPAPWWCVGEAEGRAMLAELAEWIDTFLRPHYADYVARIPRCWAAHMAAVWDLSTLRAEWIRVYGDEDNRDLQGALAWLNRYLPDTVDRIADALKQCDEIRCRLAPRYT